MISEIENVKKYLINKFGELSKVPLGRHIVPTETSQDNAFMAIDINVGGSISGGYLWWDEAATICWYTQNKDGSLISEVGRVNKYTQFNDESLKKQLAETKSYLEKETRECNEIINKIHLELYRRQNAGAEADNYEAIKDLVLSEYKKGNIVISGSDNIETMKLTDFIKQPVEGMLYDLNRNEMVILTFINDLKWVNDYAACQVIRELKKQLDEKK